MACERASWCADTSVEKTLAGFTCPLFAPVQEAVFRARAEMYSRFGPEAAVKAILGRTKEGEK